MVVERCAGALFLIILLVNITSGRLLSNINVDATKLEAQFDKLASFSDDPNPAVTRVLFTGMTYCCGFFTLQCSLVYYCIMHCCRE